MVKTEYIEHVYKTAGESVTRLLLGERIAGRLSKVSPRPYKGDTGTIGYMDFQVRPRRVPRKNSSEPYRSKDYTILKSFTILVAGVEPEYRGRKYFSLMMQLADKLANELNCDCIVYDMIQSELVLKWVKKKGLKLFDKNAVKYLRK